jgi:hypothetical protein
MLVFYSDFGEKAKADFSPSFTRFRCTFLQQSIQLQCTGITSLVQSPQWTGGQKRRFED